MKNFSVSGAFVVLIPLTILVSGLYWYSTLEKSTSPLEEPSSKAVNSTLPPEASLSLDSDSPVVSDSLSTADQVTQNTQFATTRPTNEPNLADPEVSSVGLTTIDDSKFLQIQKRLRTDEEFRRSLLSELRYNTDPIRGKRLAALLGDLNYPEVVNTAAELAYSGDSLSRRIGLDLLSRLQPFNDDARDIAIDLLTSETDPEFLVSTMNVLATPAQNATSAQTTQLHDNLSILANHPDAAVRSHSITLLSRWSPNTDDNQSILVQGLTDENASVRARSTSAFIGKGNISDTTLYALLQIAEDSTEIKTTRQSALYALQKSILPPDIQSRYEQAVITVRRTRQ